MGLNTIKLPVSVIAGLYGNSLMETSPAPVVKTGAEPGSAGTNETGAGRMEVNPVRSLGNNAKNILVVVNNRNNPYLPDQELNFLTGILSACKLSMEDVAIINMNNNPGASAKNLTEQFKSRVVLLFDMEPAAIGLPVNFPTYQLQPFAGTTYLGAPSLAQLENDKLEKSKLWVCLKRLFNL